MNFFTRHPILVLQEINGKLPILTKQLIFMTLQQQHAQYSLTIGVWGEYGVHRPYTSYLCGVGRLFPIHMCPKKSFFGTVLKKMQE